MNDNPHIHLWQPTGQCAYQPDDVTAGAYQPVRAYVEYRCTTCGERQEIAVPVAKPGCCWEVWR